MTALPATDLFTPVVDFTAIPLDEMLSLADGALGDLSEDVIAMVLSGQCAESIQGQRD